MAPKRFIPLWFIAEEHGAETFSGGGGVIVSIPNWLSRAAETFDVWTFTLTGTITAGDVYSIKRNGKQVSFTATNTSIATTVAGLLATIVAQTGVAAEAEFTEYAGTGTASTVVLTAVTAGLPATFTFVNVASNTGALAAVHTTTATGPNNWNDAVNWDTGSVPGNGDTANVNLDLGSILDGFAQSGVTLAALNIFSAGQTTNTIGLPKINRGGYTEDRALALNIGATLVKVDCGSGRVKLKFPSAAVSLETRRTASQGLEQDVPALLIEGGDNTSTFEIDNGSMGLAFFDGQSVIAASLYVGQNGKCVTGAGAAVTTISNIGQLDSSGTLTTLNQGGNQAIIRGTPAATTITGTGGKVDCRFGGTLAALSLRNCTLDKSNDLTPLTVTATTLHPNGSIVDPQQTITYTAKPALGAGVRQITAA